MALDVDAHALVSPGSIPEPGYDDVKISFFAKTKEEFLSASYYLSGPYIFTGQSTSETQEGTFFDIQKQGKVLEIHHNSKKVVPDKDGYGLYKSGSLQIARKGKLFPAALPVGVKVCEVRYPSAGTVDYYDPLLEAKARIAILSVGLKNMLAAGFTIDGLVQELGVGRTALEGALGGKVRSNRDTIDKVSAKLRGFLKL